MFKDTIFTQTTDCCKSDWNVAKTLKANITLDASKLINSFMYVSPIEVERIVFNPPAVIVFWNDDTKTIVKTTENDVYDPQIGFLMAYHEKMSGKTKTQANKYLDSIDDMFMEQMAKLTKKKHKGE